MSIRIPESDHSPTPYIDELRNGIRQRLSRLLVNLSDKPLVVGRHVLAIDARDILSGRSRVTESTRIPGQVADDRDCKWNAEKKWKEKRKKQPLASTQQDHNKTTMFWRTDTSIPESGTIATKAARSVRAC